VKRQRDRYLAIEHIKACGGFVEFVPRTAKWRNYSDLLRGPGQPRAEFPEEQPTGKPWMRQMLGKYGKYHGSSVVRINLSRTILSPDDAVFDIGVLTPLNDVKQLHLGDPVTDDDLTRLPRLPELEYLSLSMLEPISDRGLSCLDRMPNLKLLQVSSGNFTAKGFKHVGSRHKLAKVMLGHCEFSEDVLVHLAELPNLTTLLIDNSTLSDSAVPHLARLHGLKELYVSDGNITAEGVTRLREALPKCKIYVQFGEPEPLPKRKLRQSDNL
jgi:hypothetical protein